MSWEQGHRVFEELLLDADWALNAGNWMWLSASAFYYQYYRVYSPVAFGKKTDPNGKFIRKYCPELKNYPSNIIFEPWKASTAEQRQYKCIIGTDYPNRIVVHEEIININKSRMKRAYEIHNGERSEEPVPKMIKLEPLDHKPLIKIEPKEEPIDHDEDPENFC